MKQDKISTYIVAVFCVAVFLLLAPTSGRAQLGQEQSPYTVSLQQVSDSVHKGSESALTDISDAWIVQNDKLKRDLLFVFNDPITDTNHKLAAAFYLGELRYDQAAGALASNVDMAGGPELLPMSAPDYLYGGGYPVAEALIKIGPPAIPYMLTNIETSTNTLVQKLSVEVIARSEGGEYASLILNAEIGKQTDAERKQRLKAALDAIGK